MLNRKISRVSRLKVGAMLAVAVMGITSLKVNIIQSVSADQELNGTTADLTTIGAWTGANGSTTAVPGANDTVILDQNYTGITSYDIPTGTAAWGSLQALAGYTGSGIVVNATGGATITFGSATQNLFDLTQGAANFT